MCNIEYFTDTNRFGNETYYAKFNGIVFYKKGSYYYSLKSNIYPKGTQLHHAVYMLYYGLDSIPNNFHVHHVDCNKSNNDPLNLQLVTPEEHNVLHNQGKHHSPETLEKLRKPKSNTANMCKPKTNTSNMHKSKSPEHADKLREILKLARLKKNTTEY